MELTELQKVQILQLIHFAEVEANKKGLNVKYITKEQMKDVLPIFFKFNHTEAVEQIKSLTDIASQLHKELTAPRINQAHWQTRTFERPRRKVKR